MGVGGQCHALAALPPGKTRYPLYRRLGGPQGQPERVRKISLRPGFNPQAAQHIGSGYTDCAIPAPLQVGVQGFYASSMFGKVPLYYINKH